VAARAPPPSTTLSVTSSYGSSTEDSEVAEVGADAASLAADSSRVPCTHPTRVTDGMPDPVPGLRSKAPWLKQPCWCLEDSGSTCDPAPPRRRRELLSLISSAGLSIFFNTIGDEKIPAEDAADSKSRPRSRGERRHEEERELPPTPLMAARQQQQPAPLPLVYCCLSTSATGLSSFPYNIIGEEKIPAEYVDRQQFSTSEKWRAESLASARCCRHRCPPASTISCRCLLRSQTVRRLP
jgi:hypothetical protein